MINSFPKKHLNYSEQVELLESRNLSVLDYEFAVKKLKNLNYYRLTPYFYNFFERKDYFKAGSSFEDIVNLYNFDKDLRSILFSNIESIEIYIRAKSAFAISKLKGAFGYLDEASFNAKYHHKYTELLSNINREVTRSKEVFVKKYISEIGYLPVWAMVEVISMGSLSMLYSYLTDDIRKEISGELKIPTFVLQSWLHTLTYIRNICAHHSRLWNKDLAIEPVVPRKNKKFNQISNKRLFFILAIINDLNNKIDSNSNSLPKDINILLDKYLNINIKAMGFHNNWKTILV